MKNKLWVKHYIGASDFANLLAFEASCGLEGYGVYCKLKSFMEREEDFKLKHKYRSSIAYQLHLGLDKLDKILEELIKYELFISDGDSFWDPVYYSTLVEGRESYDKKSAASKKAIAKRWHAKKSETELSNFPQTDTKRIQNEYKMNTKGIQNKHESNAKEVPIEYETNTNGIRKECQGNTNEMPIEYQGNTKAIPRQYQCDTDIDIDIDYIYKQQQGIGNKLSISSVKVCDESKKLLLLFLKKFPSEKIQDGFISTWIEKQGVDFVSKWLERIIRLKAQGKLNQSAAGMWRKACEEGWTLPLDPLKEKKQDLKIKKENQQKEDLRKENEMKEQKKRKKLLNSKIAKLSGSEYRKLKDSAIKALDERGVKGQLRSQMIIDIEMRTLYEEQIKKEQATVYEKRPK